MCAALRHPACLGTCPHQHASLSTPVHSLVSLRARAYDAQGDVSVIDVRGKVETETVEPGVEKSTYLGLHDEYLASHIPVRSLLLAFRSVDARNCRKGAVFWDWTADGLDSGSDIPVQLGMDPDVFAGLAEEKGINSSAPVVIYDSGASGSMFAARVWWALKCHGHQEPRMLQGGWKAWLEARGEEDMHEPCPLKVMAQFEAEPNFQWYADKQALLDVLDATDSNVQVVDVRSAAQYKATVRRSTRGGRIPGAISLPYKLLLDGDVLQSPSDLQATLSERGIDATRDIILYCNGGVSACVAAAALDVLGCEQWRVYDGSWNEWGNDASVPIDV